MSDSKSILSYFKESELVTSVIAKYSLLIIFNACLLFLCAVFEVFGVGMLVPVIESIQGDNKGSFFANIASDLFEYLSIDYSPINLLVIFGTLILARFLLLIYQQRLARVLSASITFDLRKISLADVYYTGNGKLANLLQKAIFNKTNIDAKLSTFGGTSDGRFIAKYCPVVEFGLVGRTMHQVDEKIRIDDFFLLTEIYIEFIDNYFNL